MFDARLTVVLILAVLAGAALARSAQTSPYEPGIWEGPGITTAATAAPSACSRATAPAPASLADDDHD